MKGWELLKEIAEWNIKEGTLIEVSDLSVTYNKICEIQYKYGKLNWEPGEFDTSYLADNKYNFEIIKKENTINIQDIEELNVYDILNSLDKTTRKKINEIIKAIKQLDKDIKEKKI